MTAENTTPPENPSLSAVIAAYLESIDAGVHLDRAALLATHPKLAGELRAFFAGQDRLERAARPARDAPALADPQPADMVRALPCILPRWSWPSEGRGSDKTPPSLSRPPFEAEKAKGVQRDWSKALGVDGHDARLFAFAGLDRWHSPDGGVVESATILRHPSSGLLRSSYHVRSRRGRE